MDRRQRPQKVPLAGVLNSPEDSRPNGTVRSPSDNRDSAYYSINDASSKPSGLGLGISPASPAGSGSGFHTSLTDNTPSPTTTASHIPQPLVSPINGGMSINSMVSPTTPGSADYRRNDRPQSFDSAPNSATFAPNGDYYESLSRRESVDSRMNQGFGEMRLAQSPYASHNQSTSSFHNTMQRAFRLGSEPSLNRLSGYQPNSERHPPESHPKTRIAPTITGPATSQIAKAPEPTKGQAWAFPEEEIQKVPSGASHHLIDSRRSSIADSFASSQYTTESRLPPGQRRLDEGLGTAEYHRRSNASGEYSTIHHHSLQHRQLNGLQNGDLAPHSQPYSRTPELRVSHKLAERKRRTEMKELFEQLRDMMPQERGSKASKWEILTKAISEHQRLTEAVHFIKNQNHAIQHEMETVKRENEALKMQLRAEQERARNMHANHSLGIASYGSEQFPGSRPEQLPPLRGVQPSGPSSVAPEQMSGVQYEAPRQNGYRPPEQGRY